jgi:hypothetical protein
MLNHKEIEITLTHIRPRAEWSLSDGVLTWLDNEQSQPNEKEIIDGHNAYIAETAAKKAAAEAKLAALGLTADDLKALGLGGN